MDIKVKTVILIAALAALPFALSRCPWDPRYGRSFWDPRDKENDERNPWDPRYKHNATSEKK